MENEFLTVKEFAQKLRLHENTVRKYIKEGLLQGLRLGGRGYRIPSSEIQRLGIIDLENIIEKMVDEREKKRKEN